MHLGANGSPYALNQPTGDSYTWLSEHAGTRACALKALDRLTLDRLKGANVVWTGLGLVQVDPRQP